MNLELLSLLAVALGIAGLLCVAVIAICRRARLSGFERRRGGVRLLRWRQE
jgi:hypothetical protein